MRGVIWKGKGELKKCGINWNQAVLLNSAMASAAPNVDLFDAYFRRADLDRDGRISGAEAVSFFQGSGLPKHVLAQVSLSLYSQSNSAYYLIYFTSSATKHVFVN